MPAEPDPLDDLAPRFARGEMVAIEDVYRRLAPMVRSVLIAEMGDPTLADDLVGETFLELVRDRTRLDFAGEAAGRRLRAYVLRAARNNLIDWRRRAARRGDHELTRERAEAEVDPEPTPEEELLSRHDVADALHRLQDLSEAQREVLELRLLGGLSLAEVADVTGRTVGAVKALQHRAMRQLARRTHGRLDRA